MSSLRSIRNRKITKNRYRKPKGRSTTASKMAFKSAYRTSIPRTIQPATYAKKSLVVSHQYKNSCIFDAMTYSASSTAFNRSLAFSLNSIAVFTNGGSAPIATIPSTNPVQPDQSLSVTYGEDVNSIHGTPAVTVLEALDTYLPLYRTGQILSCEMNINVRLAHQYYITSGEQSLKTYPLKALLVRQSTDLRSNTTKVEVIEERPFCISKVIPQAGKADIGVNLRFSHNPRTFNAVPATSFIGNPNYIFNISQTGNIGSGTLPLGIPAEQDWCYLYILPSSTVSMKTSASSVARELEMPELLVTFQQKKTVRYSEPSYLNNTNL